MKKELKQCPFCGGEAYVQHFPLSDTYEIRCSKCCIGTWPELDRGKAVEKWNRRKQAHTRDRADVADAERLLF